MSYFTAPTAQVAESVQIGHGSKIWDLAQIREDVVIGKSCVIGRGVYVGPTVQVGDDCKIQNLAQIFEPARLANGVFIGPAAVLTNDQYPRAVTPNGELKSVEQWNSVGVTVHEGASIGARAVCVAPVSIGRWSLVGAGATVVKDVPDFALVVGSPAKQIGWVGKAGIRLLQQDTDEWICPQTSDRYVVSEDGTMVEMEK